MLQQLVLAWDGQWFLKTSEKYGTDEAVALNQTVGRSCQRLVARMSLKAWKAEKAADFEDAGRMIRGLLDWSLGNFWKSDFEIAKDSIRIEVVRCPFFEGAKQANLERTDQACLNCAFAWSVWIDALLPGQEVKVTHLSKISEGSTSCLMQIEKA
jgi:hypothetical protein